MRRSRLRGAGRYVAASTVSSAGDFALWLATGIWVKSLTGSSSAAGLVFFCFTLGSLTSPLTGILVDRVRRGPLMILTYLVTAAMVTSLLLVRGRGDVWLIYLVLFLYGVSGSIAGSAQSALLPHLVDDDVLAELNGMLYTLREGVRLVTPLIGAGLYAWFGGGLVALVDAGSFVVAAALLATVRVRETRPVPREQHWREEVGAGMRFLLTTVVLRQLTLTCGTALLVVGFLESIAFSVVTQGLHHPPAFLGVIEVAQGAGAVLGGLTAARLMRRTGGGLLVAASLLVIGVACPLMAVPVEAVVFAAVAALGIALPWLLVGLNTVMQRSTPSELRGRVVGASDLLINGPQTISIALGAMLVALGAYQDLLYAMAAVLLCCACYLGSRREQRSPTSTGPVRIEDPTPVGLLVDAPVGVDPGGTPAP